jgi:hypothetical protein
MTKTTTSTATPIWNPTAAEVEAALVSMRPLIQRFADRDNQRLALWASAA